MEPAWFLIKKYRFGFGANPVIEIQNAYLTLCCIIYYDIKV